MEKKETIIQGLRFRVSQIRGTLLEVPIMRILGSPCFMHAVCHLWMVESEGEESRNYAFGLGGFLTGAVQRLRRGGIGILPLTSGQQGAKKPKMRWQLIYLCVLHTDCHRSLLARGKYRSSPRSHPE